jgi:hypothetical protein
MIVKIRGDMSGCTRAASDHVHAHEHFDGAPHGAFDAYAHLPACAPPSTWSTSPETKVADSR